MAVKSWNVVLLFGGRSAEHEVSILSARSIREAAERAGIRVTPICINREGRFLPPDHSLAALDGSRDTLPDSGFSFEQWARTNRPDVVFPIVHGTFGEDGTLQGYLEILDLPYVGSGVTGSAVGMDKVQMKSAFARAGLPIVEHLETSESEWRECRGGVVQSVLDRLGFPCFAKPANAGSSVGVSKVRSRDELEGAIEKALRFDDKVLIEEGVDARELEVSVLGNEHPEATPPGEIITGREFYDYEDKYIEDKSRLEIPATIGEPQIAEIRELAVKAFLAVGASGYARVDFFLDRLTGRLLLNEINTIPGFTRISMYPKLWEANGLPYPALIERLVELGYARWQTRRRRFEGMMRWFDEVRSLT